MKTLFVFVICAFCTAAAAQGMYKCKDASGKITYAGNECHMLGLTPAGDVKGQANVAPAQKVPPPQPRAAPAAPSAPPVDRSGEQPSEAKAGPERKCFAVKTAKGTSTRCNDGSGKDDKAD